MSTQLLIYEKAIPLNKDQHADWSVEVKEDFAFTKGLNALPLLTAEFLKASREYPIVFSKNGDSIQPVVALGLRNEENLYLDDSGKWLAKYTPAFLRRYPFVFAMSEDGKTYTLCIDESFPGFNQDGKGQPLFTEGEPSQYVNNILQFLQSFQAEQAQTQALCQKLDEFDLFEASNAVLTKPDGEKFALTGFLCISRAKLKELPPKVLAGMIDRGEMDLIYAHLLSLDNFNWFKERLAEPVAAVS